MLPQVERSSGIDQVHVLRCLVEAGTRWGRAREVLEYAVRAARSRDEFALDPHTGWYIAGVAEMASGELRRARMLAERGAAAAEERGDVRYLYSAPDAARPGPAPLRGGCGGARGRWVRIRDIDTWPVSHFHEPMVNRWHADLVSAEVSSGPGRRRRGDPGRRAVGDRTA